MVQTGVCCSSNEEIESRGKSSCTQFMEHSLGSDCNTLFYISLRCVCVIVCKGVCDFVPYLIWPGEFIRVQIAFISTQLFLGLIVCYICVNFSGFLSLCGLTIKVH